MICWPIPGMAQSFFYYILFYLFTSTLFRPGDSSPNKKLFCYYQNSCRIDHSYGNAVFRTPPQKNSACNLANLVNWTRERHAAARPLSLLVQIYKQIFQVYQILGELSRQTTALCVLCDPYLIHVCVTCVCLYIYVCVFVYIKQGEKRKKVYKSGDDDQNAL